MSEENIKDTDFGRLLEKYLSHKNMYQRELAQRCKLSEAYIFLLIHDERKPSRKVIVNISLAMELEPEQANEFLLSANETPLSDEETADYHIDMAAKIIKSELRSRPVHSKKGFLVNATKLFRKTFERVIRELEWEYANQLIPDNKTLSEIIKLNEKGGEKIEELKEIFSTIQSLLDIDKK